MEKLKKEPMFYLKYERSSDDRVTVELGCREMNTGKVSSLFYDDLCRPPIVEMYYVEINQTMYNRMIDDHSEMVQQQYEERKEYEEEIERLKEIINRPWYVKLFNLLIGRG